MIAQLLLTTLVLGAPDYTKKVMVDPNYRPSRTPQQIERVLARARYVRVVRTYAPAASTIVYRTEVRRRSWVWPAISLGLWYGTFWAYHGHHHHYRHYGGYRYRHR